MNRIGLAALLSLALSVLAGCGQNDQVVVYKPTTYSGKSDSKPWDNAAFAGDRAKWENSVRARGQNQNESKRIGD